MKVFIYILCIISLDAVADEGLKLNNEFDFSGVLLEPVKISKVKDTSLIVDKYVQDNYNLDNHFFCGGAYMMTPDQALKNAYENGAVQVVTEFGFTNNVQAFTPIRQLVQNPDKKAVFNGYYFVSSKR